MNKEIIEKLCRPYHAVILFMILFCTNFINAQTELKTETMQHIANKLDMLDPNTPFIDFDLGLSEKDKFHLEQIKTKQIKPYDNYGKLDKLQNEIDLYLQSVGNNKETSHSAANIITRIVNNIISAFQAETA